MKKFLIGIAALSALIFISCDSKSKLANNLDGSWSGSPERLGDDSNGLMTMVETYNFIKDDDKAGGTLIIQAMISVTGTAQPNGEVVQPYAISESAVAFAEGTWMATDDDELNVTIDPQTITVSVDPSAVTFNDDVFTDEQVPMVDSIKPEIAKAVEQQITKEVTERFTNLSHIDDIKVRGNLLKYEIGRKRYTMSKEGVARK